MKLNVNPLKILMALCVLGAAGSAGCVYTVGTTLPPDLKTIRIPMFVNKTQEPELESHTTQATVREIQKDGNLRIAGSDEADLALEVTITSLDLDPLRYERDEPKTTREYRMWIKADMVLTRTATRQVMIRKAVQGEATFLVTGDLSISKKAAYPAASADLARKIVEAVVEYW